MGVCNWPETRFVGVNIPERRAKISYSDSNALSCYKRDEAILPELQDTIAPIARHWSTAATIDQFDMRV
jgi:hypothetical protein